MFVLILLELNDRLNRESTLIFIKLVHHCLKLYEENCTKVYT